VRASRRSVFARAWRIPVSLGEDQDLGDVRLDQPLDLPGVARHLERDAVMRAEAPGEELDLLGLGLDPPRGADLSILCDRHLAELEVDVESDCSHFLLLHSNDRE
jgi:hypothetical protein